MSTHVNTAHIELYYTFDWESFRWPLSVPTDHPTRIRVIKTSDKHPKLSLARPIPITHPSKLPIYSDAATEQHLRLNLESICGPSTSLLIRIEKKMWEAQTWTTRFLDDDLTILITFSETHDAITAVEVL